MFLPHPRWLQRVSCGVLLLASLVFLCSCSEDEKAAANLVIPDAGPQVDDSLLALDVIDGVPVGITDYFEQDEIVHLWVRWEGLSPPHQAEAVWYDPYDAEVAAATVPIAAGPADQVTDFSLELTSSSTTGRWEVFLYLDGELHRSHAFDVFDTP